jgi:hypothetical protein
LRGIVQYGIVKLRNHGGIPSVKIVRIAGQFRRFVARNIEDIHHELKRFDPYRIDNCLPGLEVIYFRRIRRSYVEGIVAKFGVLTPLASLAPQLRLNITKVGAGVNIVFRAALYSRRPKHKKATHARVRLSCCLRQPCRRSRASKLPESFV